MNEAKLPCGLSSYRGKVCVWGRGGWRGGGGGCRSTCDCRCLSSSKKDGRIRCWQSVEGACVNFSRSFSKTPLQNKWRHHHVPYVLLLFSGGTYRTQQDYSVHSRWDHNFGQGIYSKCLLTNRALTELLHKLVAYDNNISAAQMFLVAPCPE